MFDRYVAAHQRPEDARRKRWLIAASVALHVALVAGLAAWSLRRVVEVVRPLPVLTFFGGPGPRGATSAAPAPAGDSAAPAQPKLTPARQKPAPRRAQPTAPSAPTEEHDHASATAPVMPQPSGGGGEAKGADNGAGGGSEAGAGGGGNGTSGEPGPGAAQQPAPPPRPKNVPRPPDPSEWLERPDPHVPEAITIQRKGTGEGVFFAVVCLDTDGRVTAVKVKQSLPGADDAITATIRTWRARPQPIPICFPLQLVYTFE